MRIHEKSEKSFELLMPSEKRHYTNSTHSAYFGNILSKEVKKKVYENDIRNFERISISLEEIESKFLKNPNHQNYKIYADFVRFHVQEAEKKSRKTKNFKDRSSREYHVVIKINNLLEEMLELIFYGKKEILRMLRMMSQIQGLLFDVLV